ncbi:MAG: T9SS type A sorting domain-containing protein, partial [Saprospiraceae bacterium]
SIWTRQLSEIFTGLNHDHDNNFELKIYPNPTKGIFNLEFNFDGKVNIKVINLIGEVVLNQEINLSESTKKVPLDLTNAGAGIYLIQVSSKNVIVTKKVVVE